MAYSNGNLTLYTVKFANSIIASPFKFRQPKSSQQADLENDKMRFSFFFFFCRGLSLMHGFKNLVSSFIKLSRWTSPIEKFSFITRKFSDHIYYTLTSKTFGRF